MVKWVNIENRIKSVENVEVDMKQVLDADWKQGSYLVPVSVVDGVNMDVDLSSLFSSTLGNFWHVLYAEKEFGVIRDTMATYWRYRGTPRLVSRVVTVEDKSRFAVNSILSDQKNKSRIVDVNRVLDGVNKTFEYNRTVVGFNGGHAEFQFLNKTKRVNLKVNDVVDPGLFVSVNGGIKVAAGTNRLVCLNGLTQRFNAFKASDYKFNKEILDRGVEMAKWLCDKQNDKVLSTRALSVLLDKYPDSMLSKFWKGWSQKIELGELTWFDVIDNLTSYANKYIDSTRHKLLEFGSDLRCHEVAMHEHRLECPTCSAKVNG